MKTRNRAIAFFVSSRPKGHPAHARAQKHFASLASQFGKKVHSFSTKKFSVHLCYEGELLALLTTQNGSSTFCVGPLTSQKNSGHTATPGTLAHVRDRFLRVTVDDNEVLILNDYAGTIPAYYSTRAAISISNIEPVVVLDSDASFDDFSPSALYGFLRYSHFIWDETLFKHMYTQEPDSLYRFSAAGTLPAKQYMATLQASGRLAQLDDVGAARILYELNQTLVGECLAEGDSAEVVLPLSSGYDSRMILAAASHIPELQHKMKCFTYGPAGIEVTAARQLCQEAGVYWRHADLLYHFLERPYLERIGNIFGSSLHFHGMYQLEFLEQIRPFLETDSPIVTSGFMTGVPAGQHISLLGIRSSSDSLAEAMTRFSTSKYISEETLLRSSPKFTQGMRAEAEERFRKAFDRFDGEPYQKSVVFDVWTRQRNFIAYHPRTLEWEMPFISPHMTPDYANFYLSLSEEHLTDRKAVELMFERHYPALAKISSNSNGLRSITTSSLAFLAWAYEKVRGFDFNAKAVYHSGQEGLWPVFDLSKNSAAVFHSFFDPRQLERWYEMIWRGTGDGYTPLAFAQSVAFAIKLISQR